MSINFTELAIQHGLISPWNMVMDADLKAFAHEIAKQGQEETEMLKKQLTHVIGLLRAERDVTWTDESLHNALIDEAIGELQ